MLRNSREVEGRNAFLIILYEKKDLNLNIGWNIKSDTNYLK